MLTTSQYIHVVNHYVVYLTYSYMSIILKKKKKRSNHREEHLPNSGPHAESGGRMWVRNLFFFSVTFLLFQFL